MQYDNVHMTQNIKRSLLLGHIEKSRTNENHTAGKIAFYDVVLYGR